MKRGFFPAVCLLLWLVLAGAAFCAEDTAAVYDEAGLLTAKESRELEVRAQRFSETWTMNVIFLTTDDAGGKDSESYADDFYMDNGYYDNAMEGGVLFLIDMDNRQVWIATAHAMQRYLTDERVERVIDAGYEELTEEEYARCFTNMLQAVEDFMEAGIPEDQYFYDRDAEETYTSYDQGTEIYSIWDSWAYYFTPGELCFAVIAAMAAGGAAVGILLRRYRKHYSSYAYPWREKCRFETKHQDSRLVREYVTQRTISDDPPSGGGGSSGRTTTHSSSGGGSFGGGGRSF